MSGETNAPLNCSPRPTTSRWTEADRQHCIALAVELNLPITEASARRYRSRGEDLDNLMQVARLGLVEAIKWFNPASATSGFHGAHHHREIKTAFPRSLPEHTRPPRRLQELHQEANDAWSELAHET